MNIYWKIRLWLMLNISSPWRQFKFNFRERVKSTWFSIKVGSWHRPCYECWGSCTSMKYGQIQPCRLGCDHGYLTAHFWDDILFHRNWWYRLLVWVKGCEPDSTNMAGVCKRGSWGCRKH